MQSFQMLNAFHNIPIDEKYRDLSHREILETLNRRKVSDGLLETSFAFEVGLFELFQARNIPDNLEIAYNATFVNSDLSLYEHYSEMLEKGDQAVLGFVSNLKGKYFEIGLTEQLEEIYPSYTFQIAESPTQPVWDIRAIGEDGSEDFLVQAKMWTENNASELTDLMEANPDIYFAASSEIRDKIIEASPELAKQFVPIDISNYDFTEGMTENLNTLATNFGADLPDSIGGYLPFITEIILGISLIRDVISVQRDFKNVTATDKAKLSAIKAFVLFSRYGITTIMTASMASAGSTFGPVGAVVGGIAGAGTSMKINKGLKPYLLEFALQLFGLEKEDMFYYNNKKRIDKLAYNFAAKLI